MLVVYNLGVTLLFLLLLPPALLFPLLKPNLAGEFTERLGLLPKEVHNYLQDLKEKNNEIILLSAASVGEIMMAQLIIEELIKTNANIGYIIVTNSSSGQQMAKKLFGAEKVILQPIDYFWNAKRVAQQVKPKLTILVEFEMWPNFIHYLAKMGSKIVLINGSLDNKILKYYRLLPGLLKSTLNKLDFLGMKTEEEKVRAQNLGVTPVKIKVIGDLKYDRSAKIIKAEEKVSLKNNLSIPADAKVLVAASTHPGEEEIVYKVYAEIKKEIGDLVLIIAPRQIERTAEIRQLGESHNLKVIERTSVETIRTKGTSDTEVIILDTIGELTDLYSIASLAFVGGSFVEIGGHNLLEPIFYGKPVLFGPNIYKVKKTADWLMGNQIGIMVRDEEELKENILLLLEEKRHLKAISDRAIELLRTQEGAAQRSLEVIQEHLANDHAEKKE